MDLMNSGFYVDDSQVCVLQAEKKYGAPRTEITIKELWKITSGKNVKENI